MILQNSHWATDYIGKPWVAASDGPEAYDCWGLVVAIHKRLYGRDLTIIPVQENNLRQLIKTIDASRVTGKARMLDVGNKAFPSETYNALRFAGLTR